MLVIYKAIRKFFILASLPSDKLIGIIFSSIIFVVMNILIEFLSVCKFSHMGEFTDIMIFYSGRNNLLDFPR